MNIEVLSVRGLRPECGKVDRDLWLWFCEAKKDSENYHGPRITKRLVQAKAREAFQAAGILNFKASDGWYIRWLKRWHRIGLDNAKRLATKGRSSKSAKTGIVPKKRNPQRPKANTFKSENPFSPLGTTKDYVSKGSRITSTGEESSRARKITAQTSSHIFKEVEGVQQNFTHSALASIPSTPHNSIVNQTQCLPNVYPNAIQPVQREGPAPLESSSFLNLDEVSWNSLSSLEKHKSSNNAMQNHGNGSADGRYSSKDVPHMFEFTLLHHFDRSRKKIPIKSGTKLLHFQKLSITNEIDCLAMTVPKEESVKCVIQSNDVRRAKSVSSNLILGEPMAVCDRSDLQEADLILEEVETENEENFSDLINVESAGDCADSFAGNIVQHDLEDVSLSSDFVNQLNDERSFELNLGYENENLASQVCPESILNRKCKGSSTSVVNNRDGCQSTFVQQVTSDSFQESTSPADGRVSITQSEADGDFSGDESDYISEAVMLSMQEDDFSILNCDQSPFQETISITDEDSQPECEQMTQPGKVGRESMNVMFDSKDNSSGGKCSKVQEFCLSSSMIGEKMSSDPQKVLFPSFSEKEGIIGDSSSVSLTPASWRRRDGETQNKLVYPLDRLASFQTPSSLDENLVGKGREEVCLSSLGPDVFVHRQDMCHENSSKYEVENDGIVKSHDVFLTEHPLGVHFSQTTRSAENQHTIVPLDGSISDKTEEISSVYILPFSTQRNVNLETGTHLAVSNLFLENNNCLEPPIDSHMESCPRVTIANADSTMFLVPHSTSDLGDPNTPMLISLVTPNAYVLKNASLPTSHLSPEISNYEGNATITTLSPSFSSIFSGSSLKSETSVQIQASSNSINCESSKENGHQAYDHVESVQSHGKNTPKHQQKLPKKNTACLTEKGSNTARINSSVEDNQTSCRRSSGDRYFPYFKERVADYAIKHTAKEAARYFGVNVDTVTVWTKGRYDSYSVSRNYPDQIMLRWLKRNRENGVVLTREQIVEKAVQLLKTPGCWVKDKSRWFHIWASRLADENKKNRLSSDGTVQLPIDCGEKKALYPDEFKVEVVLYAEQTSKNLASTVFNIARKRVFEWSSLLKVSKEEKEEYLSKTRAENPNLLNAPTNYDAQDLFNNKRDHSNLTTSLLGNTSAKYKLNGKGLGRAVTNIAVDRELWDWFCEQTAKKSKPKSREIRAKAVELFRAHNHDKIQCSHGWLKKWSMRYGIALRHEGDSDLLAWCLKQFDCNHNISHRDLLSHAQESLSGTHKSEFKASAGWLVRFCKRHRSLLSAKPAIDVEIPTTLKPKVSEFRSHIQHLIHSSKILSGSIGSMDEVPLNFTAAGSGSRNRLLLRRSGLDNCHATVILSCLANGELLPPAVIFKGEGPTEEVTFDGVPLLLLYQQDCFMTPAVMLEWLKFIWTRNATSPSVLVADCYEPHCSDLVKNACAAAHVSLSVIPAGCSFKLQPLDLSISQQFEANIYNRWTRHCSAVDQLSACKRSLYSNNTDIAKWVAEAHSNLKVTRKEAVRRSFLVTGLTAALDGADDHLLEDPSHIPFSSLFTSQS